MKIKPKLFQENEKGEWFDGTNYRKSSDDLKDYYRKQALSEQHSIGNKHIHGVFTCPRCKNHHYIPNSFDYLCDSCSNTLLDLNFYSHEILEWRNKSWLHEDVQKRIKQRDELEKTREGLFPDTPITEKQSVVKLTIGSKTTSNFLNIINNQGEIIWQLQFIDKS